MVWRMLDQMGGYVFLSLFLSLPPVTLVLPHVPLHSMLCLLFLGISENIKNFLYDSLCWVCLPCHT